MSIDVLVQPADSPDDFAQIYHCISEAFGRQIKDSIWIAMNSNWNSPEGQREGASKLLEHWQSSAKNKEGHPNTVILKATLPDPQDGFKLKIVGAAIWSQASFVDGYGDLADGQPCWPRGFGSHREALREPDAKSDSPAMFTLDTCAVDPAFQRRGVARKLVEWGLEEAKRRGGLECTTEASPMGRGLYERLGFGAEGAGEDLVYEVDEEFRNRDKPEILFMRTWAGQ
ncbi:hypothetical protein VE04_07633 [Pseudogymnoascus sp. 24MN13]|nr:hypothetical protein VE04_07633 [Pseudogymnoascus sp. 24MN13]